MATFIEKYFHLNQHRDELGNLRYKWLGLAAFATLIGSGLLLLVPLASVKTLAIRIILGAMLGSSGITLWLIKRQTLQAAGWVFTLGMLSATLIAGLGLFQHPALAALLALPVFLFAGILAGESSMVIVGILTLGILYLRAWNILPGEIAPGEATTAPFLLSTLLSYGLCYTILTIYWRAQGRIVQRLQQNEADLFESNRELQAVRAALDEKIRAGMSMTIKKANLLRGAAEIGHIITALRELPELLSQATRVISDKFGFYHVGIFLLDERGEYAVLQAANSQGGLAMLEAGHQLKVGAQGIVGHVVDTRQAHIALNVGQDVQHYKNPHLPDTRSEMALPLIAGERIIGALDIQSKQPNAFTPEDKIILQLLADQLAVAIENARLNTEMQAALQAARQANDTTQHEAWIKHLQSRPLGFRINRQGLARMDRPDELAAEAVDPLPELHFQAPLKIRGQVIGHLHAKKDGEQPSWSPGEQELLEALMEQLSLALDNARLYEETQRRAERERLASEITTRLRALNDPKLIMETATRELRAALHADQAIIHVQPGASPRPISGQPGSKNGNNQRQADQRHPGINSHPFDE